MIRIAIVGIGRQGSKYVKSFFDGNIKHAELTALCDIDDLRFAEVDPNMRCQHFTDYNALFCSGIVDAIIIDTPHYSHPIIALEAIKHNIHVLSDKPIGVDAKTVKKIGKYLDSSKIVFAVLFNQRMMPVYRRIKEVLEEKKLGKLKRCVWEITDWYRPQKYYEIGGWRSSWKGEGGGVLINQCVHNIDMICYLFGKPNEVQSYIGYGDYHNTVVDDSVVANLIYDDGFVCTLISSTGETPGTNRLEISGTNGKMIFDEFDKLKFVLNKIPENIFSSKADSPRYLLKFGKPETYYDTEKLNPNVMAHDLCIQNFVDAVTENGIPSATYHDGLMCTEVINAIYFSDWTNSRVSLPVDENAFFAALKSKWE